MSEQMYRSLLDRLNGEAGFRERFQRDIAGGVTQLAFSPAQGGAITATDEDALRRMAAATDDEHVRGIKPLSRLLCTRWFCGPGQTRDWQCPDEP